MISNYKAQKMRTAGTVPGVTNSMPSKHRKDGFIIHGKHKLFFPDTG